MQQLAYLRALIPLFANDDRVAIWDLHNEPDQYGAWREGRSADVLDWLRRMADAVHTLAPPQLVIVGMALHPILWLPGPDGRRAIDYSDVVSVHNYAGDTAVQQLEAVRDQTSMPIIVEAFGWPTGPPCSGSWPWSPPWPSRARTGAWSIPPGSSRRPGPGV